MPSFDELEKENSHTNVTFKHRDVTGSGVLAIAGSDTLVKLSMSKHREFDTDNNGWFDISLSSGNGDKLFLHNALQSGTTSYGFDGRHYETTIFPNYIAFGADHLSETGQLTTIGFKLEGLERFFHLEVIERHHFYKANPEITRTLKALRHRDNRYSKNYEFYFPNEVWLLHRLPRMQKFRVDDRVYEIHMGRSESLSWNDPQLKFMPLAFIHFDEPTSIDDAITHVWDWRRFFSQISMDQYPFQSIWARSKRRPRGYASLYMPNLRERPKGKDRYLPHGSLAPLNGWRARQELAGIMQNWLSKQGERRVFRANVDSVIGEMNHTASPDHIVLLCAGIESVSEFDSASSYSKKDIEKLVAGATTAATVAGIEVQVERLRGLLGSLRKENVPRRIRALRETIKTWVPDEWEIILEPAQKIRNTRAHGGSGLEQLMANLSATTHALAGMLVVWDLKTSGLPFEKLTIGLTSQGVIREAIQNLQHSNVVYSSEAK